MKAIILTAIILMATSHAYGWNKDVFKTKLDECIYHEMVQYHGGYGKVFVTFEDKAGWYFLNEKKQKCRFCVPDEVRLRMVDRCSRKVRM